jgi:LysM repeat protein
MNVKRTTILITVLAALLLNLFAFPAAAQDSQIINPNAPVTYTVQPGDTLAKIAARFSMTWQQLAALNNIVNPNLIYAGQVIYIQKGTTPPPPTGDVYIVQRGDTLASIAARYGTTIAELVKLNHLTNANHIYVGQRLIVRGVVVDPIPATYMVQRGDTLYSIGLRFHLTVSQLVQLNNLVNPNRIYAGQVLKLA